MLNLKTKNHICISRIFNSTASRGAFSMMPRRAVFEQGSPENFSDQRAVRTEKFDSNPETAIQRITQDKVGGPKYESVKSMLEKQLATGQTLENLFQKAAEAGAQTITIKGEQIEFTDALGKRIDLSSLLKPVGIEIAGDSLTAQTTEKREIVIQQYIGARSDLLRQIMQTTGTLPPQTIPSHLLS